MGSALLSVVFCLDFDPFFFFSCSLARCFSFIYLRCIMIPRNIYVQLYFLSGFKLEYSKRS